MGGRCRWAVRAKQRCGGGNDVCITGGSEGAAGDSLPIGRAQPRDVGVNCGGERASGAGEKEHDSGVEAPSAGWGQRMLHGSLSGLGFHFGEYERMAVPPAASPALPLAGPLPPLPAEQLYSEPWGWGGGYEVYYTHPDSSVTVALALPPGLISLVCCRVEGVPFCSHGRS